MRFYSHRVSCRDFAEVPWLGTDGGRRSDYKVYGPDLLKQFVILYLTIQRGAGEAPWWCWPKGH